MLEVLESTVLNVQASTHAQQASVQSRDYPHDVSEQQLTTKSEKKTRAIATSRPTTGFW